MPKHETVVNLGQVVEKDAYGDEIVPCTWLGFTIRMCALAFIINATCGACTECSSGTVRHDGTVVNLRGASNAEK